MSSTLAPHSSSGSLLDFNCAVLASHCHVKTGDKRTSHKPIGVPDRGTHAHTHTHTGTLVSSPHAHNACTRICDDTRGCNDTSGLDNTKRLAHSPQGRTLCRPPPTAPSWTHRPPHRQQKPPPLARSRRRGTTARGPGPGMMLFPGHWRCSRPGDRGLSLRLHRGPRAPPRRASFSSGST